MFVTVDRIMLGIKPPLPWKWGPMSKIPNDPFNPFPSSETWPEVIGSSQEDITESSYFTILPLAQNKLMLTQCPDQTPAEHPSLPPRWSKQIRIQNQIEDNFDVHLFQVQRHRYTCIRYIEKHMFGLTSVKCYCKTNYLVRQGFLKWHSHFKR